MPSVPSPLPLAAQVGRVPSMRVPLDREQEQRFERLMADLVLIDMHQHPMVLPTDANEMPSSAARNRADQCVIPSRSGVRPSLASVATTTSISSITAGRLERGTSSSALIPPAAYRPRQPITVGRDTSTVRAICAFGIPSAASSTIRARLASPDGTLGSRASSSSRSRSPSRSTRAGAKDMLHCHAHQTVKLLLTHDTSVSRRY